MNDIIVYGSGGAPRVEKVRRKGWTKTRRAGFLDTLAWTCNVRRSAAQVGMDPSSAYKLRRRDPAFAELWRAALMAGYDHLEERLLRHAGAGVNDIEPGESGVEEPPFDPKQAVELLKLHRASAQGKTRTPGGRVHRATRAEAEAALLRKLDMLGKRLRAEGRA